MHSWMDLTAPLEWFVYQSNSLTKLQITFSQPSLQQLYSFPALLMSDVGALSRCPSLSPNQSSVNFLILDRQVTNFWTHNNILAETVQPVPIVSPSEVQPIDSTTPIVPIVDNVAQAVGQFRMHEVGQIVFQKFCVNSFNVQFHYLNAIPFIRVQNA